MVNKLIIKNIIEELLIKCSRNHIASTGSSWGVRFNQRVREALDNFHRETCTFETRRKTEKTEFINSKGEVVFSHSDNDSNSVTFKTKTAIQLREKYGELHLTHNHPNGFFGIPVMFSRADVERLLDKTKNLGYIFKSITAETANGSRITLMKNSKFDEFNHSKYIDAYDEFDKAYSKYIHDFADVRKQIGNRIVDNGGYELSGMSDNEISIYVSELTLQEIGTFESRLVPIRKMFNDCNCDLSIEWLE